MQKRFWVLRTFGMIFRVLAWLILIAGIIGAVLGIAFGVAPDVVSGGAVPRDAMLSFLPAGLTMLGVLAGFAVFFIALVFFVFIHAFGDLVHLLIALEENTRLVAERLRDRVEQPVVQAPPSNGQLKPAAVEPADRPKSEPGATAQAEPVQPAVDGEHPIEPTTSAV